MPPPSPTPLKRPVSVRCRSQQSSSARGTSCESFRERQRKTPIPSRREMTPIPVLQLTDSRLAGLSPSHGRTQTRLIPPGWRQTPACRQAQEIKAGTQEFVSNPGELVSFEFDHGRVRVQQGENRLVAEQVLVSSRDGSESDFYVGVPGKIRRMYRGRMTIVASGSELIPVVSMELETAVASVNAAEATPGATIEALKAQAVAIRSYLVAGRPRHLQSDFCDTTHCQFLKTPPPKESLAAEA